MVLNSIDKLLEKYENGETSLKEEQVLKNYFSGDNVAPHLEHYKPMFVYFLGNQQERFTKDLPLTPIAIGAKKKFNYKWLSVAAVAVIMLGVYFTNPFGGAQECEQNLVGTFCEPEEAFNEVSKQLAMISNHFNKGTSTVSYLEEVNKGASTLNYLNEIENSTSIIFKKNQ